MIWSGEIITFYRMQSSIHAQIVFLQEASDIIILFINHSKETVLWNESDGIVQERHNSSALAMELRLSCTNPSNQYQTGITRCISMACKTEVSPVH